MNTLVANSVEYFEGDSISLVGYRANGVKFSITGVIDLVRENNVAYVTSTTGRHYQLNMREFKSGNFSTLNSWRYSRVVMSQVATI